MEIALTRGPVSVAVIHGSIDSLTADQLVTSLADAVREAGVRLVADFSNVSYTSSAGLRALLVTLKDARRSGGDFRLAAVQPPVMNVLHLSGFVDILKLYDDVDAAVASFGRDA